MTPCPDCTDARAKRWHGVYRMGCAGCQARAVARSMAAADAVRDRTTEGLREVLAKAMPKTPADEALRMVWDWWRVDHPKAAE